MVLAGPALQPAQRDIYSATTTQLLPDSDSQSEGVHMEETNGFTGNEPDITPLPKLQLSALMNITVAEAVARRVTQPFIVQLVQETGITGGDITKVGYYCGLVESSVYLAEASMGVKWGQMSDTIGRRPVLFMGLFSVCLSILALGLSHSFWAIMASRTLAAAMNGNNAIGRSVIGELTDETNVARAFALLPPAWSAGNTIGPLIGGMLQHPYERFGGVFRRSEFWRINPYFLPCIVVALWSLLAIATAYIFMMETAPEKKRSKDTAWSRDTINKTDNPEAPTSPTERSPLVPFTPPAPSTSLRDLLTPRVLTVIVNASVFSCVDVAFDVLQPLILSTPITLGGLGMSPITIGACLACTGVVKGTTSVLCFPWLFAHVGPRRLNTVCIAALGGCYVLFPILNVLARAEGRMTKVVWAVYVLQLTLAALPNMTYSCIFIYLTAASAPSALGATNGLAQSVTSIVRCLGPISATSLYALSIRQHWLGGNFIYVVMCSLVVAAIMMSLLLPDKPWERAKE